ncbi:MAG: glycosyltransferase, partial [Roseimicrobium sp.]
RLLFVSNLFPDGAEPYRGLDNATVLHHLRDRWDIRVVALRPTLKAWLPATQKRWEPRPQDTLFAPQYLPVRHVPKVGGLFNHHLVRTALRPVLQRLKKDFAWDVILASWLFPDGCAAQAVAKELGTPCALIAQGSDVHRYLKSVPRRRATLEAVAGGAAVITRSKSLATLLAQAGASSAKLHPVHNGVDVTTFCEGDREKTRTELGLIQAEKTVLFVGNLLPVKNPELLLRAFARVQNTSAVPVRLALAGKGPLREALGQLAATLGMAESVRFLGPLMAPDIARWMQASDVLCLSSLNEGLPNVVLEAMASGLPVVATKVGGIDEIVDAEWKGRLVASGDEAGLATALSEVLQAPPDRRRIASYGFGLSWEATADAYHELLLSAAGR